MTLQYIKIHVCIPVEKIILPTFTEISIVRAPVINNMPFEFERIQHLNAAVSMHEHDRKK